MPSNLPMAELPPVQPAFNPETRPALPPEAAPAANSLGAAQPAAAVPPVMPLPQPPAAVPPAVSTSAATPAVADDVDLIEKEWVTRAKQIVEGTKEDPYRQSRELNKMKADYIKKRYNKDIKLPEG